MPIDARTPHSRGAFALGSRTNACCRVIQRCGRPFSTVRDYCLQRLICWSARWDRPCTSISTRTSVAPATANMAMLVIASATRSPPPRGRRTAPRPAVHRWKTLIVQSACSWRRPRFHRQPPLRSRCVMLSPTCRWRRGSEPSLGHSPPTSRALLPPRIADPFSTPHASRAARCAVACGSRDDWWVSNRRGFRYE